MKNLIDKIKENRRKKKTDERRKSMEIEISHGSFKNINEEGEKEMIDIVDARHYNEPHSVVATAFPKKSMNVDSSSRKIEYDAVVRFISGYPEEQMYFLNGDYLFTREVRAYGKKYFVDTHGYEAYSNDVVVFDGGYISNLDMARPLIEELESEIGKTIIKKNKDYFWMTRGEGKKTEDLLKRIVERYYSSKNSKI